MRLLGAKRHSPLQYDKRYCYLSIDSISFCKWFKRYISLMDRNYGYFQYSWCNNHKVSQLALDKNDDHLFTALVTKIINTPVTALDANIAQGTMDPKFELHTFSDTNRRRLNKSIKFTPKENAGFSLAHFLWSACGFKHLLWFQSWAGLLALLPTPKVVKIDTCLRNSFPAGNF